MSQPREREPNELVPSDVPSHCQIDLSTAQAEGLRSLVTDRALVFNTRALDHAAESLGAERVRDGFSLNHGMDVAWGLGFPNMAFIVDGLAEGMEEVLQLYDAAGREHHGWWQVQARFGHVYPRRAAVARMYELDPYPWDATEDEKAEMAANVLELPDEELDQFTEYKPYSEAELARCLQFSYRQQARFEGDVLLFEALSGPDVVLKLLGELLLGGEARPHGVLGAARPLFLRASRPNVQSFVGEIESWAEKQDDAAKAAVFGWLNVDATIQADLGRGKVFRHYFPYASLSLRTEITAAALRDPGPYLPFALVSDIDQLLPAVTKKLSSFEILDVDRSFLECLSSLRHPAILPAMLTIGSRTHSKAQAEAWFDRHARDFEDALRTLASDKGPVAKLAKAELGRLRL